MNVKLIDVDKDHRLPKSRAKTFPNLALMKISAYHKSLGDKVGFDVQDPDKVYISCVFERNKDFALQEILDHKDIDFDFGGSALNLGKTLPAEIEYLKPDYCLYPSEYSMGFTTRGCVRNCEVCIVRKKEGIIKPWQYPRYFHDPKFKSCMIMDNNLFAAPRYWQEDVFNWFFETGTQMRSHGWDARLLNYDRTELLLSVKHADMIKFAWDNMQDKDFVRNAITLLKNAGVDVKHKVGFYVLVGAGTTFEEDLYRCNQLKEWGTNAYVMPYTTSPMIKHLARWANRRHLFWNCTFTEYLRERGEVE